MHFYDSYGRPRYEVEYSRKDSKKKLRRPARVTDARKAYKKDGVVWYPSVTEAMRVLAQPGLEEYRINQAILSALTIPRVPGESDEELVKRIRKDAKAHSEHAREMGERIHNEIARRIQGSAGGDKDVALIAIEAIGYVFKLFQGSMWWVAEQPFVDKVYGYGGRVDLYNPDKRVIIDFKTTETLKKGGKFKRLHWPEQRIQLAAYGRNIFVKRGLQTDYRRINVYVDYSGNVTHHEWAPDTNEEDFEAFVEILRLWKRKHNYWPERLGGENG